VDRVVLIVLDGDRVAGHAQEHRREIRIAEQRRALGRNGVGVAGRLPVGEDDPAILARNRIEPAGDLGHRDDQNIALTVQGCPPSPGSSHRILIDQSLPSPLGTRPVGRVGAARARLPSLGVFQQPRLLLWRKASDLRL
jgi:hypothetical protein